MHHKILTSLHYKPLYQISRIEKWGKNIQAAAHNGYISYCIFISFVAVVQTQP